MLLRLEVMEAVVAAEKRPGRNRLLWLAKSRRTPGSESEGESPQQSKIRGHRGIRLQTGSSGTILSYPGWIDSQCVWHLWRRLMDALIAWSLVPVGVLLQSYCAFHWRSVLQVSVLMPPCLLSQVRWCVLEHYRLPSRLKVIAVLSGAVQFVS